MSAHSRMNNKDYEDNEDDDDDNGSNDTQGETQIYTGVQAQVQAPSCTAMANISHYIYQQQLVKKQELRNVTRVLHGDWDDGNTTESTGILHELNAMLIMLQL